MANKYVNIQVLTYAVQSLAQSITNTFAMRKMAVSALEIVQDIPTGSTSTDVEWCIKVIYADDDTATPHFVLLSLKQIFSDIDLSQYYTKDEIDATLADYYLKTEIDTILNDYYLKTEIDTILLDYYKKTEIDTKFGDYYKKTETYSKTEVDGLIPDVSNFITENEVDTKLGNYYDKSEIDTKLTTITPDMSDYYNKTDIDTTLAGYYDKNEVDALIPDVSSFIKESDVDTKLSNYYKKTETYNKTEVDGKFVDYYKKLETYSKDETDTFLKDKANQTDVDILSSKVSQIFSSMVDNTTLDAIVQDIKVQVANKLEDSDLNVIRSDIKNLQTKAKNLEDTKLDKTDFIIPSIVSAFENDAKYQTDQDVAAANAKVLEDAKTYVNGRIADINTLDPNDFYNKVQVDNKLADHYKKNETYNQTEVNAKLDLKAGLDTATETKDGLLSAELYSIIKEIDPAAMGKNGEDGLTPECEITTVGNVHTITFTTGDQVKSFQLVDGRDGINGKDGKNGTNGMNGTNGVSVTSAKINTNNHLIMYLSNGTTVDCGNIDSDALEIHKIEILNDQLTVTLSDGSIQKLGNVKGATGKGLTKIALDETTHEIIAYYDDGTSNNMGLIQGVKGDKGDKGEPGKGLTGLNITDGENIIATYADGSTQNLGTIVGAKGAKGDPGKDGTSISTVNADKNNNLIVTLSDGQKFNLGNFVGPDGRGIKSVGVNGNYELILTMTDGDIINAGKLEVNVKDIFVTKAELNDDGELIFTFSDGTTQNNGKISGVEGFSIREYVKLANGQVIKAGCMMLWENMIYKVVNDFTCTTNFQIDKTNMQKITTDAMLVDLYNVYVETTSDSPVMSFDEWMHQWIDSKFNNPMVSYAKIDNSRAKYGAGTFYNLTFTDLTHDAVLSGDRITLPNDGTFMLVVESGNRASASRSGERYSYIYNLRTKKYEFHTSILAMQSTDYNVAYPGFSQIISGKQGDQFQVKVKNRYETSYGAEIEAKAYLYRLIAPQQVISPDDLYEFYKANDTTGNPLSKEEWIKTIYQKDSYRVEAIFEQSYTDKTDVLLNGFQFSSGNEDMMCDEYGRFYAPYSGVYYLRLQLRLDNANNYPSRFYLVKNGKFGEEGYSTKVISQSTEGYQTSSAYLQSLNSVFWMTKGDYFTIGFQSSVKDTNTLKSISRGFEYGMMGGGNAGSGGSNPGDSSGDGASAAILLYDTIGIGTLVRKNTILQYQRRLYRVTENFSCTDVFVNDRVHMQQFYGSGHGIIDYDDTRLDHTEEFLPGEFILKRHEITAENEQGHYTTDVDDLYEVVTAFYWSGNFEYDKVNLKKILGSFDDYDTVIKKLEEDRAATKHQNEILQEQLDDLAAILDDINRTVI